MLKFNLLIIYCLNFMCINSFPLFLDDCDREAEKCLIDLLALTAGKK